MTVKKCGIDYESNSTKTAITPRLELDDTAARRDGYRMCPVGDLQLGQDALQLRNVAVIPDARTTTRRGETGASLRLLRGRGSGHLLRHPGRAHAQGVGGRVELLPDPTTFI